MKFCTNHWQALRNEIRTRGLSEFVALTGEEAAHQMEEELKGVPKTRKTYDPLMGAHWAIANNAMSIAHQVGGNPLAMMFEDPEHPDWACPICYLNWLSLEHDRRCTEPACVKEKGCTFEWMLARAADEAAEILKGLPVE